MKSPFLKLSFCNRLKEYRIKENFTQSQLAILADVSKNTISNIETGNCIPSCDLCLKLAIILGAHVEDLFYLSLGNYSTLEQKVGEI